MWDQLEFRLSQDIVSINIAWVVIKVIRQYYRNFAKQTGRILHKQSGLSYIKLKITSPKEVIIAQYATSKEWPSLKWIEKNP